MIGETPKMMKTQTSGKKKTSKENKNKCTCQCAQNTTLEKLYNAQLLNQRLLFIKGAYDNFKQDVTKSVPCDDVSLSSYHIQQLISEIGEVLECDKRWKNYRNDKFDKDAKLEELADCFIELLNIAMFSDFGAKELSQAIENKIKIVKGRITKLNKQ